MHRVFMPVVGLAAALAALAALAAAQDTPRLRSDDGNLNMQICSDCEVNVVRFGEAACRLDSTCNSISALNATIEATSSRNAELSATIVEVQGELNSATSQIAEAQACGTSTPPGVWDPNTGACRVGFALQDINECQQSPSPCAGRTVCVNTEGSFECDVDPDECTESSPLPCSRFAECDDSAVGEPAACTCRAGYYGDGETCSACPEGTYKNVTGNGAEEVVCAACPNGMTSASEGGTSCVCALGYTLNATSGECLPCPRATYKNTTGPASCTACPAFNHGMDQYGSHATTHVSPATSASHCLELKWTRAGFLMDIGSILRNYPPTHFELGTDYNAKRQYPLVVADLGTPGVRISSAQWYPQRDTNRDQRWGSVLWMKGRNGNDQDKWHHHYYRLNGDGGSSCCTGNGAQDTTKGINVRPLMVPWTYLGKLPDVIPKRSAGRCAFCVFRDTYPQDEYTIGMKIPGVEMIQEVLYNGWNRGERLTLYPLYPVNTPLDGDYRALKMGTSVLTMGLRGGGNASQWSHNFVRYPSGRFDGIDNVHDIEVYFRKNPTKWQEVGRMTNYETLKERYPETLYKMGTHYNGEIQTMFRNGWNRGSRLTLYPFYPMGDVATSLTFGTVVFSKGVAPTPSGSWTHAYYQMNTGGGYSDRFTGTNDYNPSSYRIYVKRRLFPWIRNGTTSTWRRTRGYLDSGSWDLGGTYNGDIQIAESSSWNWGERVALAPIFPMYDNWRGYHFGTAIFVRGCVGCIAGQRRWGSVDDSVPFTQLYYVLTDRYIGSNGARNIPVYARLNAEPDYITDGFGMFGV